MKYLLGTLMVLVLAAAGVWGENIRKQYILSSLPASTDTKDLARIATALEGIHGCLKSMANTGRTTPVRLRFDQCVTVLTNDPKVLTPTAVEEVQ